MQYVTFVWDAIKTGIPLAALVTAGYLVYVAVTKGLPAAWDKVKGWFGQTKRDVIALEARVKNLEAKTGVVTGATGASGAAK